MPSHSAIFSALRPVCGKGGLNILSAAEQFWECHLSCPDAGIALVTNTFSQHSLFL
jgi:hypothetical protein